MKSKKINYFLLVLTFQIVLLSQALFAEETISFDCQLAQSKLDIMNKMTRDEFKFQHEKYQKLKGYFTSIFVTAYHLKSNETAKEYIDQIEACFGSSIEKALTTINEHPESRNFSMEIIPEDKSLEHPLISTAKAGGYLAGARASTLVAVGIAALHNLDAINMAQTVALVADYGSSAVMVLGAEVVLAGLAGYCVGRAINKLDEATGNYFTRFAAWVLEPVAQPAFDWWYEVPSEEGWLQLDAEIAAINFIASFRRTHFPEVH